MKRAKKIKILLDQRSANDSVSFLETIANSFPDHDITIKIDYDKNAKEEYEIINDKQLENEMFEEVGKELDQVELRLKAKKEEIDTAENKPRKLKQYAEKLTFEGIKVSISTIIKTAIGLLFK